LVAGELGYLDGKQLVTSNNLRPGAGTGFDPKDGITHARAVAQQAQKRFYCTTAFPLATPLSIVENVFAKVAANPPPPIKYIPDFSAPPPPNALVNPCVDLDLLKQKICESNAKHLFVRAPIGSGKSTLATHMKRSCPELVIHVNLSSIRKVEEELLAAVGTKSTTSLLSDLDGKLLIVDECHLLFCHSDLLDKLIKVGGNFYLLMFSSSSAHQQASANSTTATLPSPAIVTNKTFMDLRFTESDVEALVRCNDKKENRLLGLPHPNEDAINLLRNTMLSLFDGHRLLTVYALTQIKNSKCVFDTFAEDAVYQRLHMSLRAEVFNSTNLELCRSAIINSGFKLLHHGQLTCQQVLCDGHIDVDGDTAAEQSVSQLLTRGALHPTTVGNTFVWTNPFVARFFLGNSVSEKKTWGCVSSIRPRLLTHDGISLVLMGLAWFDIDAYTNHEGDSSSEPSKKPSKRSGGRFHVQMPYEKQLQRALHSGWNHFPSDVEVMEEAEVNKECNGWNVNRSSPKRGRVDFKLRIADGTDTFVEIAVFGKPQGDDHNTKPQVTKPQVTSRRKEIIAKTVASNDDTIAYHITPFFTAEKSGKGGRTSYTQALAQGKEVVVVVFCHIDVKARAIEKAKASLNVHKAKVGAQKLKVLVLGTHSAFRYSVDVVQLEPASDDDAKGPLSVVARDYGDVRSHLNAMKIRTDGKLESNQRQPTVLEHLTEVNPMALSAAEAQEPICKFLRQKDLQDNDISQLPMSAWVQPHDADGTATGSAFKVTPTSNDIDALKKAIKAEIGAKYPTLIAPDIKIYEWDAAANTAKKDAVKKQSTPLHATTEETPYTFQT
jgi:hypothetical protein